MPIENPKFHATLSRRAALTGLLQMRHNPMLLELAQECGYDFIVLDRQLGTFNDREFSESVIALTRTQGLISMVRAPAHDMDCIRDALDRGIDAIIAPKISTVDDAQSITRLTLSYRTTSVFVVIESATGVANAEAILALEGVRGALVGPINLSTDLGRPRDYANPVFRTQFEKAERAATLNGKVVGTVPNDIYTAQELISRGHRLLILGADRDLLRSAMSARMEKQGPIATLGASGSNLGSANTPLGRLISK